MSVGEVRLEVGGCLEETDSLVVVFEGIEDSSEGDPEVGVGRIEKDSLTI
ncbi:MAG: hypothetical protein UY22_C0050G0013 [Candidatus Amesbacteria bacterium GW2011_GWC1_48_10]|uniref:Uncharacterized protein n=1 Tax=Candidatus Amesbacteria bacterium GW2011_GWC1_48_10 TaxID=1618365 RepID=A0A0G1WK78_9BACT|nr:MAG: hypothetical protein UY22_C0050G0013 [Candidatus Amesbacteria bacterium GW2011_GWC1_48_10]